MKTLTFIVLLLTACTNLPVAMPNKSTAYATMVGGKGTLSYDKYGRPIYTYNNEKSLQHFFQFGSSVIGGVVLGMTQRASDAATAATAQQAQKQAFGLAKQKEQDSFNLATQASDNALKATARANGAPAR